MSLFFTSCLCKPPNPLNSLFHELLSFYFISCIWDQCWWFQCIVFLSIFPPFAMTPLIQGDQVSTNVDLVEYHTAVFSSLFFILLIDYSQTIIVLDIIYICLFPKSLKPSFIVKVGSIDHSSIFYHLNLFPHIFHVLPRLQIFTLSLLQCVLFSPHPSFSCFLYRYSHSHYFFNLSNFEFYFFVIYKQLRNKIRNKIFKYRMTHI